MATLSNSPVYIPNRIPFSCLVSEGGLGGEVWEFGVGRGHQPSKPQMEKPEGE